MKVIIPKNSEEEAQVYLRAWLDLHEGPGIERAQRMIRTFQIIAFCLGAVLVAGLILGWHPYINGLAGVLFGYTGAEVGAMKSRLRVWPHNERYIDWEKVKGTLESGPSADSIES